MIEIDFDKLDQTAHYLADQVVEKASQGLTIKARGEFKLFAYDQMFKMLSADIPHPIEMSQEWFESVFKKSVVPKCNRVEHASTLNEDVLALMQLLDFTPYKVDEGFDHSDPQQRFERVKGEMNRCNEALLNREDYYVQNLFENTLSMEADKNNAQVFEMYFKQIQHGEALHNTCPPELKQYVKSLVEQTAIHQSVTAFEAPERLLKKIVEERRAGQMSSTDETSVVSFKESHTKMLWRLRLLEEVRTKAQLLNKP